MRARLCRHGIAVLPEPEMSDQVAADPHAPAERAARFLPNPEFKDSILDQVPISIPINEHDLADFGRGNYPD